MPRNPTSKARICYPDGRIVPYDDPRLALQVYYALEPDIRAAFRAAGDNTPVLSHDYVRGPQQKGNSNAQQRP